MSYLKTYNETIEWIIALKKDVLKAKSLEHIVILAVTITVVFGFAEYAIDPNIHSFTDGLWYAWVTMTHVGYGDVVPTSFLGRILGTLIILFGLGLFAIFAASFSSVLIGKDLGDIKREMYQVEKETHALGRDESRVLQEFARLHQRIDQLEKTLTEQKKKSD